MILQSEWILHNKPFYLRQAYPDISGMNEIELWYIEYIFGIYYVGYLAQVTAPVKKNHGFSCCGQAFKDFLLGAFIYFDGGLDVWKRGNMQNLLYAVDRKQIHRFLYAIQTV